MSKSYFPCYIKYQGEDYPTLVRTPKEIKAGIPFHLLKSAKIEEHRAFAGIMLAAIAGIIVYALVY